MRPDGQLDLPVEVAIGGVNNLQREVDDGIEGPGNGSALSYVNKRTRMMTSRRPEQA